MSVKLKKLAEQRMVITGATSGIGLTTARMAAKAGVKLILTARNGDALEKLTDEINSDGGEAIFVTGDVGNLDDVNKVAETAVDKFGGYDTWVNNAGVSIYGKIEDVPMEDFRQLFETNFWGVVHGSLAALRHLRETGGAIINVGSTLSDRAIPLQGMYCASKHAVKGFTDALRMEIEADNMPISVTLVKPGAINTPYTDHARNYLKYEPQNPPPVYAPETVAEAILYCAENPTRDVFVGGGGKAISLFGKFAPRTTDKAMEMSIDMQKKDVPAHYNEKEGLYYSADDSLNERGNYEGHVAESSLYTKASLHPVITGTALIALGAGVALLTSSRKKQN